MSPSIQEALSGWSPAPYPEDRFAGCGIVICAGGPRYFTCAWVLLTLLRRHYRINLPIQVWHLGQSEMSEEMRLLLADMDVEIVDAATIIARHPARVAGGWPLKPYALMHSRFRKALYLDADTVPLVDPRALFEWDIFRAEGLLMWPDILNLKASSPIWNDVGLAPRDHVSIEASILLVDKPRAWDVLQCSVLLNAHAEEIYSSIYGDKDTFLLACLLCGRAPPILPHPPFRFDIDIVQRDPAGDPFLAHRSGSKWNLTGPNRPLPAADLMPICEQALADLRGRWSGAVFNPPARTPKAQAEWERLAAARYFFYEPPGSGGRRLELLSTGRIGEGRNLLEQYWAVVERDGAVVLQFYSTSHLTLQFTRDEDGCWLGKGAYPGSPESRLIEESAHRTWPAGAGAAASAAGWVNLLLDAQMFAAGFDNRRGAELQAALSLLNERFDDVAESIKARLATIADPAWRRMLTGTAAALAAGRDKRAALAARADYPRNFNPKHYDQAP
jgi:hypothetical protein